MAASDPMKRRDFLTSLMTGASLSLLAGCQQAKKPPLPPGELSGASVDLGHLLRDAAHFPPPSQTLRLSCLIVGAGIGGLSAGWKLAKSGFADFLMLELENDAGGNSRSGQNAVSEYPLGAHYLPLPNPEALAVRELLAELGVLQGDPNAEKPLYDERYLCATPQERLYRNGQWEESLLPQQGISAAEKQQYARFYSLMDAFAQRRDQGLRAFALPMALSSQAPDLLALDQITMRDWLLAQDLHSPHLHEYIHYACRDDYGTSVADVSAWAGIHYFASRAGAAANAANEAVMTTPGGNAWLAKGLQQSIKKHLGALGKTQSALQENAVVFRLTPLDKGMQADVWLPQEQRVLSIICQQLIWAAPVFLLPHVLQQNATVPWLNTRALTDAAQQITYAPWLIANLTLARLPAERGGASLAWDNVLHKAQGLGYVVATHQNMRLHQGASVLTYYHALSQDLPKVARLQLLTRSHQEWTEEILLELERAHPDIRQITTRLDIFRNAHAMARPVPGFLTSAARQLLAADYAHWRIAHADLSGFSLFEEAQYRGVLAAERTLRHLGQAFNSSLSQRR